MSLTSKFSVKTLRTIYVTFQIISLALFAFVFVNIVILKQTTMDDCLWVQSSSQNDSAGRVIITKIVEGGVADTAGLKDGDILLSINDVEFSTPIQAQMTLNKHGNEIVKYKVQRGNEILYFDVAVYKYVNIQFIILSLIGINFFVIGLFVIYTSPKGQSSLQFYLMSTFAPFGITLFVDGFYFGLFNEFRWLGLMLLLFAILFYPAFVHFFMVFPERVNIRFRKSFIASLYLIALIGMIVLNNYWIVFCIVYLFFGLSLFISTFKKIKEPEKRKPLKIIILGIITGLIGLLYLGIVTNLAQRPSFLLNPLLILPTVLSFAIPISFGFAIIKYKILDTETTIKRSVAFAIITIFIICIYLVIALALNTIFNQYFKKATQLPTIISIIIITFSYDYFKKKISSFVDKQFYKDRYNYRKSLLKFSEQLPYFKNVNEMLRKLAVSVSETIGIKAVYIWLTKGEYNNLVDANQEKFYTHQTENPFEYNEAILSLFKDNVEPILITNTFLNDGKIHKRLKDEFIENEIVLLIPMCIYDQVIGIMKFGKKPSGKAYSDEDIDLLKTLTSQVAMVFENNRLKQEELRRMKFEEEISIARNIQNSLLPEWDLDFNNISVSHYSKPAKQVGGDFYDFIKIDRNKFAVIVADVSGKGIPAALYMAKVQSMIQLASNLFKSPKDILIEVNKNIRDQIDKHSFVTCVIAVVDLESMTIKVARAGHNPVIYGQNGSLSFVKSKGLGLNLATEQIFERNLEEVEFKLKSDDLFVFYSDGLSEAMNTDREEFSEGNVLNVIKSNRQLSTEDIKTNLIDSVNSFTTGAEQHDDITIVILKISEHDRTLLKKADGGHLV